LPPTSLPRSNFRLIVVKLTVPNLLRGGISFLRKQKRIRDKQKRLKVKERGLKNEADSLLQRTDEKIISLGKKTRSNRPFRLVIGPTNSAGQARQWSIALSHRNIPTRSFRISNDIEKEWFQSDIVIPRLQWTALAGRIGLAENIVSNYDAILIESMRPLFSLHTLRDYSAAQTFEDIRLLNRSHVKVAIVFHGSDIRDTEAHARREKFSPYRQQSEELQVLQRRAAEFRKAGRKARKKGIPIFVTTPDLLLDLPGARWLPITIDVEAFVLAGAKRPCWSSPGKLRVLFQPSRGWLKSAQLVEPILHRLAEEGVIQLIFNEQVEQHHMAERITSADVVIDRFDGIAGVTSMEALASGRVVLANIAQWAYKNAEATPPILHSTPDTLEATLRHIAKARETFEWDFSQGLEYVRKWHDGKESAARITKSLKL
jgi:hypothetical protein